MDANQTTGAGATPAAAPAELPNGLPDLLERLLDEAEQGSEATHAPPSEVPPPPAAPAVTVSAPPTQAPTPPSRPTGGSLLGGLPLGGLLANPALLAALPTLAENLGPLLGSLSGGTGSAPTATRPHTVDRHTALLCAVKPYLSPQRQSAAETVIRLCRVWDALDRSGISLSGLLGGTGGAVSTASPKSDGEVT